MDELKNDQDRELRRLNRENMVEGNDADQDASREVQKATVSATGSIDQELIDKEAALKRQLESGTLSEDERAEMMRQLKEI